MSNRAPPSPGAVYAQLVPPQNPITRIEAVARDLGRLAEELGGYAGQDARSALMYWQRELLGAVEDLQRIARAAEHDRRAV